MQSVYPTSYAHACQPEFFPFTASRTNANISPTSGAVTSPPGGRPVVRSLAAKDRLQIALQVVVAGTPDVPATDQAQILRRLANELDLAGAGSLPTADFEFRRAGDAWIVTFDGATVAIRHLAGMPYVSFLLANPNQVYSPLALEAHINGTYVPSTATRLTADDRRQLIEQRRQLEAWATGLADGHEDLPKIRQASNEIERRLRGGFDEGSDEFTRAKSVISAAVTKCMRLIQQHHPSLHAHLKTHLTIGVECAYLPNR